jgi:hypothetical protein
MVFGQYEGEWSGLEIREYDHRDPSRWPRGTPYPQELALTSRTNGGRSVGIVRSRTQATEFSSFYKGVWRPERKADNLNDICERIV